MCDVPVPPSPNGTTTVAVPTTTAGVVDDVQVMCGVASQEDRRSDAKTAIAVGSGRQVFDGGRRIWTNFPSSSMC